MQADSTVNGNGVQKNTQIKCYEMISNITGLYKEIGSLEEDVNRLKVINAKASEDLNQTEAKYELKVKQLEEENKILTEENKKLSETISNYENNFRNETLDQNLFGSNQTLDLLDQIKNNTKDYCGVNYKTPEDMRSISVRPLSDTSDANNMIEDTINRSDSSLEEIILDANNTDDFICQVTSTKESSDSTNDKQLSPTKVAKQTINSQNKSSGKPKVNPLKIKRIIPATISKPPVDSDESTKSNMTDEDMTMSDIVPMNDFNSTVGNVTENVFSLMLPNFEKLPAEHEDYDKYHPFRCKICKKTFSSKSSVKEHIKYSHNPKYQNIPCKYCHRIMATDKSLKAHILRRHTRFGLISNKSDPNNSINSKDKKIKKNKHQYRSQFCSTLNLD